MNCVTNAAGSRTGMCKRMGAALRMGVFAFTGVICVVFAACQREEEDPLVKGLREIAPASGTGVKRYYYSDGKLWEELLWEDYLIKERRLYDRDGSLAFVAFFDQPRILNVRMSSRGEITEIFENDRYLHYDGYKLLLDNGRLIRIQLFRKDELVWEYVPVYETGTDTSEGVRQTQQNAPERVNRFETTAVRN